MDDPSCDRDLLYATYRQFAVINAMLSRWGYVYRRWLRPLMAPGRPFHVLDVGFGGGDVARALDRWARRDGLPLQVTAVELDPRALDYVRGLVWPPTITFRVASLRQLADEKARYDAVISNAVLHHLQDAEVREFLQASASLARRVVVHNDLVRSRAAWALFSAFIAPWLRGSFAAEDGRRSVRRSFRPAELRAHAGSGWTVETLAPYRQLVQWTSPGAGD